ncbi:MAG: hypothetical protein IKC37_00510, partial [Clostridia bacterium]|nr:hypothetical protein [Clostridia bacterium]
MEKKKKTTPVDEKPTIEDASQATAPQLNMQPPKAVTAEQTQSQTVAPETSQLNNKPPKSFTAYLVPEAAYSDEAALDVLRQKLRGYKEIHLDFLAKVEEDDAFTLKREYIPVYRQSAVVDYAWTVKNKGEKTDHTERRSVSCRQHNAPAFFRADSFPTDIKTISLVSPKQPEELFACKHKTFSSCAEALKREAKAYAPQKNAKAQLYNRSYEIFYVPVLKAVCKFEDKEYVAYVNLING